MEDFESGGYGADKNGLGQLSAFAGVAGLVLSIIPYGVNLSIFLAPVAIVTGLIARRRQPRKAATIGLVTGLLSLLLIVVAVVVAVGGIQSSMDASLAEIQSSGEALD